MGNVRDPQMQLGEVGIGSIGLDMKSRDDIPALLPGLQHLYSDGELRARLFALMEGHMLPGVDRKVGRPGMEMWRIPVMGVGRQGLGRDFDRLHEPVTRHRTLRRFPGHADVWDGSRYHYRTLVDNVGHLNPELPVRVSQLVGGSGHAVAAEKPGAPLHGRCDSLLAGTDVHHPTDVSLLWDAMRCLIRTTGRAASDHGVPGWRRWRHLTRTLKGLFNGVRSTRRASPERVEGYPAACREPVQRAEKSLPALAVNGVTALTVTRIRDFLSHAERRTARVDRRLPRGGRIPHGGKVFPVSGPHTRWIPKGRAGCPVEPGVPVCVLEDRHGFILHHEVMWKGSDVDHPAPMVEAARKAFPDLRALGLHRGFHSPENRPVPTGCWTATPCGGRAT